MSIHQYRGFTIERNSKPNGLRWIAAGIVDGYLCRFAADTLAGAKQLIREKTSK
jgi:hypothetical protein